MVWLEVGRVWVVWLEVGRVWVVWLEVGRIWVVWLDKGVQQMMVGRCSSMDQWVYGFVHCILSIIGVPGYTARRRPLGAVALSIVGSIHSGLLPSSRKGWLTL